MQLDLFAHSQPVILQNAVMDAVQRRHAADCRAAIIALAASHAGDPLLPDMEVLCRHLEAGPLPACRSPGEAAIWLEEAEARVEPAATRLLGSGARAWLIPVWRALAGAMASLPFDPQTARFHAAPLLLRCGDWPAAIAAIAAIPAWRRQPEPLAWMIRARYREQGLDAALPLLAELAWMAPQLARPTLFDLADDRLLSNLRRFEREFENEGPEDDFAWFPAWLLIRDAGLAGVLRLAEPGNDSTPERVARLLMALLILERQGRHAEIVAHRCRLRELGGALFPLYMQSR